VIDIVAKPWRKSRRSDLSFHIAANRVCAFHQSQQNHCDGYASDFQRPGIRQQL